MILVKAAPVLTSQLQESMCVAAIRLDSDPAEWVRLHPVPFRDLEDESKFRKYQEVTVEVIRPTGDRRPESWVPLEGSIQIGQTLGTDHGWATRRQRISSLPEVTMCDLIEQNRSGSGPNTQSLGVVRLAEQPELLITERDPDQLRRWTERAEAIEARPSLFDDPNVRRAPLGVVPWRFRYSYRCLNRTCGGHKQTIVDWEAVGLWRHIRGQQDWRELMRKKFVEELWSESRDSVLFVGNMEQRPWNFLVLGVFWPPTTDLQQSLFI